MISPIRSLCFNDDRQTFTIILPSQYRIFRCDPFGMIFTRECDDLSLGCAATYNGYRYIALAGSPSSQAFNSKSVRIFDHQTGQTTFEHVFQEHILNIALGSGIIVCCMHLKVEIWNINENAILHKFENGLNVHIPLALSRDSSNVLMAGATMKRVSLHKNVLPTSGSLKTYSFVADEAAVSLIRFSDNGNYFATAAFNGNCIRIWDCSNLCTVAVLDRGPKDDIIQTMDFSPSDDFFASCSKDGTIRIFDIRRKVPNATKKMSPACSTNLEQQLYMPRICWLNSMIIGITTLEGDYYKFTFNGSSIEYETTPFLKRSQ
ncbi:hypothetical protein TRFO_37918 [Tritrichomonas foetus]|uniref:Uncharacterized protein n=1 Tax=Tritrichomonas foetus TaxID=1144522 RepID=A0A1J4JFE5_9EUKA|nr:hypothetical protein TRFO_37918 [Tritrichomonas foetus]|eukprot:OHS95948.1 hypothetical protein TRFO_37918 [Tritrichomonas foetus]